MKSIVQVASTCHGLLRCITIEYCM